MDDDPRIQLQPHLPPGAALLWAGRPDPGKRFTKADRVLIPYSVFLTCFITVWMYLAISDGAPRFFPLFGGVFVLMAGWLTIGRFVHKVRRARKTAYGLTADTAYIVTGGELTEIPLRYAPLTITGSSDGRHLTVQLQARDDSRPWWQGRHRGLFGVVADNTGAELLGGGSFTHAFHDVADVAGLRHALEVVNRELDRR